MESSTAVKREAEEEWGAKKRGKTMIWPAANLSA
jgi:hypothetical protein